ncbi:MAG: hypothetical protein ABW186_01380 [Rhodanobacteraceae bacterium]
MELDEMKAAWLALDRRLAREEALTLITFRERRLDRLRAMLRPLIAARVVQIVLGAVMALAVAPFWVGHLSTPHFVVIGAALHLYALMMIIGGARDLFMIHRIDYAAPVVEIQLRLAELRAWLLRSAPVFGAVGCFIWIPFTLWAFEVLFGADIWAHAPEVVWIFVGWGVVALGALLLALRVARHPGRTKWAERFERGMIGGRLANAQRYLDEISAFAREP